MTVQKAKPSANKAATSRSVPAPAAKTSTGKPGDSKRSVAVTAAKTAAKQPAEKKQAVKGAAVVPAKPEAAGPRAVKKAGAAGVDAAAAKAADRKADQATQNKLAAKPTPEERYRMVETAAYFIAEQHGFQGRSDEHWAAAEREIAAKLGRDTP
jgi:hypothetical protein